jgi:adenylate cyclase
MAGEPGDPIAAPPGERSEAFWHEVLTKGTRNERSKRRFFLLLPHEPRCHICAAPFAGFGAPLMRFIGKRPSAMNPRLCTTCFAFVEKHHGGAEIECTLLFADVRGSTALAERMSPGEFRALLDRFYVVASKAVFAHDGAIDKFVGDEVVAMFYPLLAGDDHVAKAVAAAQGLLRATGHGTAGGPWLPIGAGVQTGTAWVGAVGLGSQVQLTALGDPVNTASRLASAASAGEILVSTQAATAAGLDAAGLERRTLDLKGKAEPMEVVVVR